MVLHCCPTTFSKTKREKKRQIRQEMHISMQWILPSELTLEILSRLPTDSVVQCRKVCRAWRDILRHPSFTNIHLQRLAQHNGNSLSGLSSHNATVGLLLSIIFTQENSNNTYCGEYQNQPSFVSKSIVGSCNGLICFSETSHFGVHEPSYISNPITGDYANFPRLNVKSESDSEFEAMVCGFGYHPSTNKYKIVNICYIQNQPLGRVKVYTLGSGSGWRDIAETSYSLRPTRDSFRGISSYRSPFGTLANGALHWIDKEYNIVSFDLAKENLYLLRTPPRDGRVISVWDSFKLVVLGGCLCFVHAKQGDLLDIWLLVKKGENSGFNVNEQDDYESLFWIKEFSIPIGRDAVPCALTNSGEVLLHYNSSLFCYDPETAALERLTDKEILMYFLTNPEQREIFVGIRMEDNGEIDA
ncbi:F-box protein At3g07870-like [Papaver somniferum]|uniref:F-box protein At3g07870-like n=1 Tax=Papaver somniferum TaxID=3469 RepID=UPI000E7039AE|nr:F-box protein At3g07870-like [Papaver somniferum]